LIDETSEAAPVTVAEKSGFTRTSSHAETAEFLDRLRDAGAPLRVETLGRSHEGRPLQLAVLADPLPDSPPAPGDRDRLVVFVQANIHAGEVAGKEAALMLLRDLGLRGESPEILERAILLVLPDYNPDGNDRFGPVERHRPGQRGPEEVGRRHNAQDLDLNRDYMKARSTEFPLVARGVFQRYDPDLFFDLHTTNGSFHGYAVTYAPPLHPGGAEGPRLFTRDRMLPEVRDALSRRHGYESFDYGNFDRQEDPTRWATYDYRGRLGWNYVGLRGRIGILVEAYSYAPFQNRIDATYHFVQESLRFAADHAGEILDLHREADRRVVAWGEGDPGSRPPIALRAELARRPDAVEMLVEATREPEEGRRRRVPQGLLFGKRVEVYDRFEPSDTARFPAGWLLPPELREAIAQLEVHGVAVGTLASPWRGEVETYLPGSVETTDQRFSGGRQTEVRVERRPETRTVPAGWRLVRAGQRHGILAFHLLEPDAADSLVTWHRAGFQPEAGTPLPYLRVTGRSS